MNLNQVLDAKAKFDSRSGKKIAKKREKSREKTDFIKYLFQTSPTFFMSINPEGKTMFMSDELLQLLGYGLEEVIGKDYFSTFVPKNQRNRLIPVFEMLRNSHDQIFDENILLTRDGKELFVKWQWWSVFDSDNHFDFFFGVGSDITEFIRSEENLKKREAHYRVLAENVNDVIWTVDIDLRFTYISPSINNLLGYSVQDVLGYPLEKILTPASWEMVKDVFSEELTIKYKESKDLYQIRTLELEFRNQMGFIVPTENRMEFIHDENGHPVGILIVTRDIYDLKQKEEDLRDKVLQTLFDGAPNPIFVTDEIGRYLDANLAGLDFLGCDKKSLIGKEVKDFSPDISEKQKNKKNPFRVDATFENDYFVNGIPKTLLLSVVPITLSDKTILFWIGQDITKRKHAEEALKEGEEKYRLLIENQTDLVVKMDAVGRFLFVSPSYCRLFGKTEKDLIGKSFLTFIHKEDRKTTAKALEKVAHQPYTCFIEHRVLIKSKLRWLAWSYKGLCDQEGNVDTIVGGGRDITKRKKAEQEKEHMQAQLLQAQKMEAVGNLAGGIAHDFNNLITVIKGHSELVTKKMDKENPFHDNLQEVIKAAKSASSLTSQLLAFSRRQMLQPMPLDLSAMVKDTEKMISRLIGEDICLKTITDPFPAFVKADPTQMTQVIINLTVNALDSMPNGGELIISTQNLTLNGKQRKITSEGGDERFVCLTVQDTGHGIDRQTLQHIFEPFFTTKAPTKGTGLGLSVVYGIIKQHKGWIDVQSKKGRGTTFKIYLPATPLVKLAESEKQGSIYECNGERILIVEDEGAVRKYVKEALLENGYPICEASSAKEALYIFDRENGEFDLVISDVVLPEINGINLVELLLMRKPDLKVLLTSGYMDHKSQWPIIKERGFRFLQKPFELNDLYKAVREALV